MRDILKYGKFSIRETFRAAGLLLLMSLLFSANLSAADEPLINRLKDYPASLKTNDLEISTLLTYVGRQAGLNIYVDDKIDGKINIDMENLSLYEIFNLVMEAKDLHYTEKGNLILVERESDFKASLKDMDSVSLCSRFGNVGEYIGKLRGFLSKEGSITETNRGNCFSVRDRKENVDRITQLLSELDKPVPQVHIEAQIVSISQEAKRKLGIRWGYDNLSSRNPVTAGVDLSIDNTSNLAVGFIRDNLALAVDLQALQQDDMLNILSAPQILVLDGMEAEIKQGKEIPYVVQSGDILNTSFREATLSLKVTPLVLRNDFLKLDVVVTNDSVDLSSSSGEPLINKQSITTSLFLENNATVVIGGILLKTEDNQRGSVPGISKVPLFGNLFKNSEKSKEHSELIVFITPKIVNMPAEARFLPDQEPAASESADQDEETSGAGQERLETD
jgi:type II secretory pathway component GspD/PulD (secretin)